MSDQQINQISGARRVLAEAAVTDPIVAANKIVEQTSGALAVYFTRTLQDLQSKMEETLQPPPGTNPLGQLAVNMTKDMIEMLIRNVEQTVGAMTRAAPMPDAPASETGAARQRDARSGSRRKTPRRRGR
jgi:hypothetical protein